MKKLIHWMKMRWFHNIWHIPPENPKEEEEGRKENPYLPCIRQIMEQILPQREMTYGTMRLLIIDTDTEPESLLDEDDVMAALEELSPDLNYLTILTGRAAYFQEYVETMYEETGLPVQIEPKETDRFFTGNTVLDFEQRGGMRGLNLPESTLYIPVYKKPWEAVGNLDICVPIGYNTVTVKGIRAVEKRGRVL